MKCIEEVNGRNFKKSKNLIQITNDQTLNKGQISSIKFQQSSVKFVFGIALLLFLSTNSFGQVTGLDKYYTFDSQQVKPLYLFATPVLPPPLTAASNPFLSPATNLPKAYCYDDLAAFCKLEVKMEKAFSVPIKVRLGEVNDVERLEGKPHTLY